MNINFHMYIQLNNELIQRYFMSYNNKWLDESQNIRSMIWMEQSYGNESYE
jgi:hypothetical protein